jgi:hypothetical protein
MSTTEQPTLFNTAPTGDGTGRTYGEDKPIARPFTPEQYDRDHPDVWQLFVKLAREAKDKGLTRFSARAIIHRIRWEYTIDRADNDGFKINDHMSTYYAHKLVGVDPRFADFFEFRSTTPDKDS